MLINDKNKLRQHFKDVRIAMDLHERKTSDISIFRKLIDIDDYKNADDVLVYVSSQIEVDTYMLIAYSLIDGKRVLAPRCVPNSNDMNFFVIKSFDDIESGAFGIYEPKTECEKLTEFANACCIVPALSYDKRGYRLGFGKGFYDKFLQGFNGRKIGVCYSNCISDNLPNDEFDIPVDVVVTDNSMFVID